MAHHALVIATSEEFLTIKALGTFTGASTGTIVVSNTLRYVLRKDVVWLPVVIAICFAALQSSIVGAEWASPDTYLLIALNGMLLFCTALGANQTLAAVVHPEDSSRVKAQGGERLSWLTAWL
jgi:hypothetical protein